MPLKERQPRAGDEPLPERSVPERTHRHRREHDSGLLPQPSGGPQDGLRPDVLALLPRWERVERHEPHGGIVRERVQRFTEHVRLHRGLPGHIERVVL